jgi:hypothetical protein
MLADRASGTESGCASALTPSPRRRVFVRCKPMRYLVKYDSTGPEQAHLPVGPFKRLARNPTSRLMKRKEAAAYCGLSVGVFNAWVAKGLLPGSIGGRA